MPFMQCILLFASISGCSMYIPIETVTYFANVNTKCGDLIRPDLCALENDTFYCRCSKMKCGTCAFKHFPTQTSWELKFYKLK